LGRWPCHCALWNVNAKCVLHAKAGYLSIILAFIGE
jgi:hypothetical protein